MDEALSDALNTAWRLLVRAAADRRSPMHTPVVATIAGGAPDARVMVLRAADRAAAMLRFHTDARSPKCAAMEGAPVMVLAYHPGEAIQLRIAGTARIDRDSPLVDAIWAQATPFARRCYLVEAAPGTRLAAAGSGLPAWVEGRKPTVDELVPARDNFAVVQIDITRIDWLHLAQAGHARAVFCAHDGWAGEWCVP
jgi:hypothetical protein